MDDLNEKILRAFENEVIGPNKLAESMDKGDYEKYKKIVMRLLFANFKKFGDMKKAKKATFDTLEKQSTIALNAFIKKALTMEDLESLDEDKELNEAEEVNFEDFDDNKRKFISSLVGKGREKNQSYFSGIHGTIVKFRGQLGHDFIRLDKKDLKKLANNKDVRWIDVSSMGMGYNV